MVTGVPPTAETKSDWVVLNTRTFLPFRSSRVAIGLLHQKTIGGLLPGATSLALNFFAIDSAITGFQTSQALRAGSPPVVITARAQPSHTGSSPALLEHGRASCRESVCTNV